MNRKLEICGRAQKKCLEILFPPVIGKPKVKVTFGNFSKGKTQPSAEDFAECAFGSVFSHDGYLSMQLEKTNYLSRGTEV